jgi:hypothetical protein
MLIAIFDAKVLLQLLAADHRDRNRDIDSNAATESGTRGGRLSSTPPCTPSIRATVSSPSGRRVLGLKWAQVLPTWRRQPDREQGGPWLDQRQRLHSGGGECPHLRRRALSHLD